MFYIPLVMFSSQLRKIFTLLTFLGIALGTPVLGGSALAQSQGQSSQQQNPNQQQAPEESGGPGGDIGPYAIPKKTEQPPPPPPPTSKPKNVEGMPDYSIHVDVPLVSLDVGVMTKNGQFIPGLKKEYFKVYEDGVPQTISSFTQIQAPITAVMLVEFSNNQYFYSFQIDSINAAWVFAQTLKKEDWIAMISFDLKVHILEDFTQDKGAIRGAIASLQPCMAMSQETNVFDALYDTLDRLEGVDGRKYVILVTAGRDSFSKHTLDQTLKKVQGGTG